MKPPVATIPGVTHHEARVDGTTLHYVSAGTAGSPILLVHGFPETWWAFHRVIPLLARTHRVFAVDLPGLGDSSNDDGSNDDASKAGGDYGSAAASESLLGLIEQLDVGPVHLTGQDFAGATVFRMAATHPRHVRSLTAIETGLPGFGLERLADVAQGGAWYIGVLVTAGIPELLLAGRERAFMSDFVFPAMTRVPGAVTAADLDEFARTYSRPNGYRGAAGLYRSLLGEGAEIRALADSARLTMPVLAIGGAGGGSTHATMTRVTSSDVESVELDGVGHYVALEAPERLSSALLDFLERVDLARAVGDVPTEIPLPS